MKANRRRSRRVDPLATAAKVGAVLEDLGASLPDLIPRSGKTLSSLLNSVRGLYTRPHSRSNRGKDTRYAHERLPGVSSRLRGVTVCETSTPVGVSWR
jgi:hypothetical protein